MDLKMSFCCLVIFLSLLKSGLSQPSSEMQMIISREKIVNIGETVDLQCSLRGSKDGLLIWSKSREDHQPTKLAIEAQLLITNKRMSILYIEQNNTITSSLQIKNVQESDASFYLCEASSLRGKLSKRMELGVKTGPAIYADSTVKVMGKVGKEIEMKCYFSGFPQPRISWSRANNVGLPQNAVVGDNILWIPKTKKEDSGVYYCSADNGIGPVIKHGIDVNLQFLPVVILPYKQIGRGLGSDLEITCSVNTYPNTDNIIWKKDGGTIETDSRHTLSFFLTGSGIDNSVLHIDSLQKEDLGIYTCIAINSLGSISTQTVVHL